MYLHRMTSSDVRGSYFFAQPRFKPIGEGENFHSCNIYQKYIGAFIKVGCATRSLYVSSGPTAEGVQTNRGEGDQDPVASEV